MVEKNLAIVTMSYGSNYGNKLQNYAMQFIYETMGFNVETIRMKPVVEYTSSFGDKFKNIDKKIVKRIRRIIYKKNIFERIKNFKEFDDLYLKFSEHEFLMNSYESLNNEKYQFYSVGSDQVWNSYFDEFSPIFLLDCLDDSKVRISYAASFGCNSINPNYKEIFEKELKKFKAISVRENEGQELIESFENLSAEVVLDPTLLLEKKYWDQLSEKSKFIKEKKYILTYFLGEIESDLENCIKKYSIEKNLEIINLNKISNSYYSIGPIEFVDMIKKAELIFTDSFHACCFSILYEKLFWVVTRNSVKKNMNSRIITLLKNTDLEERWWDSKVNVESIPNYKKSLEKLEIFRERSLAFLNKALNMEKK